MAVLYYIPAIIAFFSSVACYWGNAKSRHIASVLLAILAIYLTVVVGLRYQTGIDWDEYVKIFEVREFDFSGGGIAFYVIKVLLSFLSLGFQSYILLMFLISMTTKYIAFKRNTPYYLVTIMLYLSFWYLTLECNQVRQGAALGFTLLSIRYISERNLKKYLFWATMAVLFHNSAITFLPLYWLSRIRIPRYVAYLILLVSFILAHSGIADGIISFLVSSSLSDSYYTERVVSYTLDEMYNGNILFSFTTIHKVLVFVIIIMTYQRYPCSESFKQVLLWASIAGIVVYFLFCQYEIIATRLALFFRAIELLSLSYLPFIYKRRKSLIVLVLLFMYSVFQIYNVMLIEDNGLIPYHNFLFG